MASLSAMLPSGDAAAFALGTQGLVLGRQEDCEVVLASPYVSRRHARIVARDRAWWLLDLGSTHGTFVNGSRISEKMLMRGDEVRIADYRFLFDDEGGLTSAKPAPVLTSLEDVDKFSTTVPGIRIEDVLAASEPEVVASFRPRESALLELVRMSDGIHRCNDIGSLCRVVVETALRATRADRGVIALRDASGVCVPVSEMEARRGTLVAGSVKVSQTFVERALREKTGILAHDASKDVALSRSKSVVAMDIKSMVCVPLLLDGSEVLGWLYLDRIGIGKGFAPEDLDVLSLLGLQAASAASRLLLAKKAIEEEARHARLSRFLSSEVIRHVEEEAKQGVVDPLSSTRAQIVTMLFADIRGFTALSEVSDPADLKKFLDAYFDRMTSILVDRHGGTLDKFIGDGVMALFGAPWSQGVEADARRAVAASLDMISALGDLRASFPQYGQLQIRIGINTGRVVAGMIGSARRMEYSVLGDAVNVASRLEGAAPAGRILVGETTHTLIAENFDCESAGELKFKNRAKPVRGWLIKAAKPANN